MAERIYYLIDLVGIDNVMTELSVVKSQVYRYRSGNSAMSFEKVAILAKLAEVNINWLATGKGKPKGMYAMQGFETVAIPFHDGSGNAPFKIDKEFFELDINVVLDSAAAIKVPDDSMSHQLSPGGVCILNKSRLSGNGTFAVRVGGIMTIRKMQTQLNGSIKLKAANPLYDDIYITKEETNQLEVLGHVVWHGGNQ